jgi:hypothetical protein
MGIPVDLSEFLLLDSVGCPSRPMTIHPQYPMLEMANPMTEEPL